MPATFNFPGSYLRHVEAYIATAVREIREDQKARANGQKPVVPDRFIDTDIEGRVTLVSVPDTTSLSDNLGDHMHVIAASSR